MNNFHTPVLLQEVLTHLYVQKGKKYIDATLGGGGHALEIVKRGGSVLGIDVDQEAIDFVKDKFQISNFKFQIGKELILVRGNFRDIDKIARSQKFENVSGILFDLGVSSHQIDTPGRGFSYIHEGPLDMRMGIGQAVTAADLINALLKKQLYELFTQVGQDGRARAIVDNIVSARGIAPITRTSELVQLLLQAYGMQHDLPKTRAIASKRVFQALRIAVNSELATLQETLPKALALLASGGRLVVISFHSLEDSIVKHVFAQFAKEEKGIIRTKKPIEVSREEAEKNPRSKSSKLRVFEKGETI